MPTDPNPPACDDRALNEARAREAATREIIEIIGRSRDDETPVFEALLEKAAKLCDAANAGLSLVNEERTHLVLTTALDRQQFFSVGADRFPLDAELGATRSIREGRIIHREDIAELLTEGGQDDLVSATMTLLLGEGIRTILWVPLVHASVAIGSFGLFRHDARPFSDDEIALVETFAAQAVIAIENVRQFRELQTRLEREAATREILHAISQSRNDEKPVFDVILANAARLCKAPQARLHIVTGARTHFRLAAAWGEELATFDVGEEFPIDRPQIIPTAIREVRTIHVEDISQDELYAQGDPIRKRLVDVEGIRTYLTVPLVSEDRAFGSITLSRREVKPFGEAEIALVETFAAQAVIAIENVRQFRELQTRLEREEASREILGVISRSRDDEQPVFDTILENARRLCNASMATMVLGRVSDKFQTFVAHVGVVDSAVELYRTDPVPMDPEVSFAARAIHERKAFHLANITESDAYKAGHRHLQALVNNIGVRTILFVPLMARDEAIGAIALSRQEVEPFSADQVALIETFAAQAVIAIENVRQFRELQTRLAREEASREILAVISRSRDNEVPVFDVILKNALNLCDAPFGSVFLYNDTRSHFEAVASRGARSDWLETLRDNPPPNDPSKSTAALAGAERRAVQIDDLMDTDLYRNGQVARVNVVNVEGMRTAVFVPMITRDECVGVICLYRREVRRFNSDQIDLVKTFAAQAVIAIENVRQFRELKRRLEREAASREILGVISRSRDDDLPVFDTILENAARLCDAPLANLNIVDDSATYLELVTEYGDPLVSIRPGHKWELASDLVIARAVRESDILHVEDLADDDLYRSGDPIRRQVVDDEGVRTFLAVPLMSDGRAIGSIGLIRREVKPFTEDQIALVRTFAAQAVIAIENVRQFRELQTRLEREAATKDVLQAISQSRDDEGPVFDVLLETAARLCNAPFACLFRANPERTHLTIPAFHGSRTQFVDLINEAPMPMDPSVSTTAEAMLQKRPMQIADFSDTEIYRSGQPHRVHAVDVEDVRTVLIVPLIVKDEAIGAIFLYRREVSLFADDEIALVETFAAQAVIAIENVRQFRELQNRLEREAATGEVLGVISRSRDDRQPVFDIILENASRLCKAPLGFLTIANDERTHVRIAAHLGARKQFQATFDSFNEPIDGSELLAVRVVSEGKIIRMEDISDDRLYRDGNVRRSQMVDLEGVRSILCVPLVSGGQGIGGIVLYRREISPFSDDDVALVENFAAQAVIAIDNVRQLNALVDARDDAESALADLTKAQERLIQAEKMASLGQLTAGIAHEIKNPLNFVNNFAKLSGELLAELGEILEEPIAALDEEDREDAEDLMQTVRENLDKINQHGRRADGIVKNMLLHSREGPSQRGTARVNSIANEALNLAYHGARAENPSFNIEMKTDLAEDVGVIECYPQDLMRVFLNIISNGMYAAYKRGQEEDRVVPEITVSSRLNGDRMEVDVRDNGQGIPEETLEKIFTPFFTTKPAGEGTGLGLSLSYDIVVKQHGGDLTVNSEPGQFTIFKVSLPLTLPAEMGGA